ncbi:serine-rich adhesin for platelets-like [Oncorhynchus clarkii lewisi]|uniref:serine-rich adhesin for platelets-like n=1 Tax=Oncorhynchus clarkii lewisi TaxID=490388 RepID=UPI0039B94D00
MATGQLRQNGGVRDVIPEDGSDRGGNCGIAGKLAGDRGRTEWRRLNLPKRSKSLDWSGRGASPGEGLRTGLLRFSGNLGGSTLKRAESLESRRAGESNVLSRVKAFNSVGPGEVRSPVGGSGCSLGEGVSPVGLAYVAISLERASGGQSLPTRLSSSPGPGSGTRKPAGGSLGSSSGQSIWDRIQKLYGTTGTDKATNRDVKDSTRTKRLSAPVGDWSLLERDGGDTAANRRMSTTDSVFVSPLSSPFSSPVSSPLSGLSRGERNGLLSHTPLVEQNTTHTPLVDQNTTHTTHTPHRHQNSTVKVSGLSPSLSPVSGCTTPTLSYKPSHTPLVQGSSVCIRDPSLSPPLEDKQERGKKEVTNTVGKKSGSSEDSEKERVRVGSMAQEKEKWTDVEGKGHKKKEVEKRGRDNAEVFLPQHRLSVTPTRDSQPITTSGVGVTTGSNPLLTNQLNGKTDTYDRSKTPGRGVAREQSLSEDVFEANTPQRITLQNTESTKLPGKLVVPSAASVRNKIHQFEALTQTSQVPVPNYLKPRRAFSVPEQLSESGEGVRKSGLDRQSGTFSNLGGELDIPLNGKTTRDTLRDFSIDEPDLPNHTVTPQDWSRRGTNTKTTTVTAKDTSSSQLSNSVNNSDDVLGGPDQSRRPHSRDSPNLPSPVSDDDKTPTNTPQNSPFHPQNTPPTSPHLPTTSLQPKHQQGVDSGLADLKNRPVSTHTAQGRVTTDPAIPVSHSGLGRDSLSLPLTSSSPSSLPLLPTLARWKSEEGGWSDEDTDDEGTEKDSDSTYDSDSAESSVTVTSAMSQSHRRSFSLSLAELCNFGEVDYDPQSSSDSEEWPSSRSASRSASLSSDVSALSCVSVLGSDELNRLLDDVKSLGDTTLQNYEDVQVVVLHKDVGVGLGFTMAGGVDQNKPVIVHKVFPAGVAAKEGSIQEGDKVLSINGTALCGSSHWEVLRTLRRARTQGMGVVVLRRGGVTDPRKGGTVTDSPGGTQTEPANTGQRVCVRLEKRSRDLGFSLEGGVGSSLGDKPLTVQKLFLGGPVNQVSPGDEVMEIEGVSLVGLRRLEAWTLIRTLPPGPVDVVLHRPHIPQ